MQDVVDTTNNTQKAPALSEIEALFEAGAHLGYSKSRRHPAMKRYIFGTRNNVEIFDLEKTISALASAEGFLNELGKQGKTVLWVGTKPSARAHILAAAEKLNMPHVTKRWLGGTLTNFKIIEGRLVYWRGLENDIAKGGLDKYVKKERLLKLSELQRLTKTFGGLRVLQSLPDALVLVDPKEEKTASSEARKRNIPIVALLNADCDPAGIAYPVPANDESSSVIAFVLNRLSAAYEKGIMERKLTTPEHPSSAEGGSQIKNNT